MKERVSPEDIREVRALVEPLRGFDCARTAEMVAEMSDEMLEAFISTTRETDRQKAIKKIWDVDDWVTRK